jgi:hypothetical protein
MDRLVRILVATLLVGMVSMVLFGGGPDGPVIIMIPLGIAGVAALLLHRPSMLVDLGWAGRVPVPPVTLPSGGGSAGPPVWVADPRPPATSRQVAAALGRAEVRQWVSSPWFACGVAFCVLMVVLFGWVWTYDTDGSGGSWRSWFVLFPIMAFPMVGMAVVGAHSAVTRSRHDGAEAFFEACPTGEDTRTAAHLRCAWVPAAVLAAFVVLLTGLVSVRSDHLYGPIDARALADVLTAVALGACGVGLGVALGRWAPWRLVPIMFVVGLLPLITGLGGLGEPHWSNLRQLSAWPRYPDHDLLFSDPPVWWHLLWIAALGALMGFVAFAHSRRDRRVMLAGLAITLVAAGAGVAQTRPLSGADAARLASLVAEPELHQTCRTAPRLEMCVYRGYEGFLGQAFPHAAVVAAAAPDSIAPVTFRQLFDGDLDVLGPEVARELARRPAPPKDVLRLGYETGEDRMMAVRLATAVAAVGLPTEADPDGRPAVIAGESRGVVALWLAARGLNAPDAQRLADDHYNPDDHANEPGSPTALDLGMAWPDPCSAGPPPVAWSAQDLAAARALLVLPADQVHALILAAWGRFTDAGTTTDELLAAAGLAPVGPPDHVVAEPIQCDW